MSTAAGAAIVVGVDGSLCSLAAVRVAAAEAANRGRPLRIVHAFVWPALGVAVGPAHDGPPETGLRYHAEQLLTEAATEAHKTAPDVPVSTALIDGAATPVLLHESRHATLLVLGDRGLGGFSGLILGSVAVQAVTHAACPVLVVRGTQRPDGPVVVGVDGSEVSQLAVAFAFEEAAIRRADLVAVHAWIGPVSTGPGDMLPLVYDPVELEAEEQRLLNEALAGYRELFPEVTVREEPVRDRPGHALVEHSKTAQLVVVGARGRGGFSGLLLGSVSQTLIYHAECPVAVVRASLTAA